jgi:uncharacterized protein
LKPGPKSPLRPEPKVAPLAFGGHRFFVAGNTALVWPHRAAIIVADLHLEKSSWFAERGQMLPPHDSLATLERLAALIKATQASEIWCLGDNFHDAAGAIRLAGPARALLGHLTAACDWHWITGNHDERLPASIGGAILPEAEVDGLVLRHRAEPRDPRAELSGHFHPKHRARTKARAITRPCFIRSETKLILPAFGSLTGGLTSDHPEIGAAVSRPAEALIAVKDTLLCFKLA